MPALERLVAGSSSPLLWEVAEALGLQSCFVQSSLAIHEGTRAPPAFLIELPKLAAALHR